VGGTGLGAWLVTGFDVAGTEPSGFVSKVLRCFVLLLLLLLLLLLFLQLSTRIEDVWGTGGIDARILNFGTRWR
jgi:hypothetical protein